ncbi:MAG: cyanophycin synthetase, partial [Oscillospiraceae bacterium]
LALETICVLREGDLKISDTAVFEGLSKTSWPARFEILSDNPFFVVDGGHNPQCAETVAENLREYFPKTKTIILFGVLADKDYMGLAKILNTVADAFVTITPQSPRALSAGELATKIVGLGKPVTACDSIPLGIKTALDLAGEGGVVCSVGSLYTAGEVRRYFGK